MKKEDIIEKAIVSGLLNSSSIIINQSKSSKSLLITVTAVYQ